MSRLFAPLFLVLILRSLASQRKSSNNVSLALSPLYKKSLGIEEKKR